MNTMWRWLAGCAAVILTFGWLPNAASAAPLPKPTALAPAVGATVDQPVFQWSSVEGAIAYEIEVALDDQFVTLVDPPLGATPEVPPPITVYGTTYIPTRSYQAKTMYWHVRAVGSDLAKGVWSDTGVFTRRWTNTAEPAGTDVSGVPASRVEGVRLVSGGNTPAINNIAVTWDAVPGAAFYEVQFSTVRQFGSSTVTCRTPHTELSPYMLGYYLKRPTADPCDVNNPRPPAWVTSTWQRLAPNEATIKGKGVIRNDVIKVRFGQNEYVRTVLSVTETDFTVADTGFPEDPGEVEWTKDVIRFVTEVPYYVRVRAIDYPSIGGYPYDESSRARVTGMWSDERREPTEDLPPIPWFTPGDAVGSDNMSDPVTPTVRNVLSTDLPALSWAPVRAADYYRLVIALDRDFTDVVAEYDTRSARFVPNETLDDNGPNRTYFWFALPCTLIEGCVPPRNAINSAQFVGTFAKHSAPVTNLSAQGIDGGLHALLRWDDALTAAGAATPGGVSAYQLQITGGDSWVGVPVITTDNLAYATTLQATRPGGSYRWRVRPLDGDGAALAWAEARVPITLTGPPAKETPTPTTSPSTTPGTVGTPDQPNPTPTATYDINPGAGGGTGNVVPTRPGKPKVLKVAKRVLRVRWNASTAYSDPVSGYLVMQSRAGKPFRQVSRTSARSLRLRAKPGEYRYYVIAVSAAGNSRPSATTTFMMR